MSSLALKDCEVNKVNINMKIRNFLDIKDFSAQEINLILNKAKEIKAGNHPKYLEGKQLAMIFEKASTRTRVSFEVGINQLGGNAIFLNSEQSQIGRGEPIQDTAGVLSRYADLIMIRTFEHEGLIDLAENASIPVINGLTNDSHPCQIMADILTINEKLGDIKGKIIAWFGDWNNMSATWVEAANLLGFELRLSMPEEFKNKITETEFVKYYTNPLEAAKDADVITTDTWVSMGDEGAESKIKALTPYQVNAEIMAKAKEAALFLHCLPAHRGEEVTTEVIDGEQSVIYDEAENRLHAQKAIMLWCMGII